MTTEALKTTAITNMDANPPLRATAGKDGAGLRMSVNGYVTPGAAVTSTSTYQLCRLPSNVRDVKVEVGFEGTVTTLTGDFTIYYSDLTSDEVGAGSGDTGLVNSLNGTSSLFAHAEAVGGLTVNTMNDISNLAGNYGAVNCQKELWDAAGLSKDPGGFFDVVMATTATNSLTAGAILRARVSYTVPYL